MTQRTPNAATTAAHVAAIFALTALAAYSAHAADDPDEFLLIRRLEPVRRISLIEISPSALVYGDDNGTWSRLALDDCVAILSSDAMVKSQRSRGLLVLADGQRLPGKALFGEPAADSVLVWNHTWLGRLEVPLEQIRTVLFQRHSVAPPAGDADMLLLANGDLVEGFIRTLGDPVAVEVESGEDVQIVEIPLTSIDAVNIVTPSVEPRGRRVWMADGTVVDARQITLGDDGIMRFLEAGMRAGELTRPLSAIAAVQFDHQAMTPFAGLKPMRVEGPAGRYIVPQPTVLDDASPLGLSRVEFRGPLTVRYALPGAGRDALRFVADARLPVSTGDWADCELIIYDDEREVYRTHLLPTHSSAAIDVMLSGATVTIEVAEAGNGPIQDHIVLHRAMLLRP